MSQLRDKDDGCEWDKEQTFRSIAPYTIEEAYEVADAIEREDISDLKEELGDLLLQVVFLSQIANEEALFSFDDVAKTISEKLVRRHPFVFSDKKNHSLDEQVSQWEEAKQKEKRIAFLKTYFNELKENKVFEDIENTLEERGMYTGRTLKQLVKKITNVFGFRII